MCVVVLVRNDANFKKKLHLARMTAVVSLAVKLDGLVEGSVSVIAMMYACQCEVFVSNYA